MLNFGQALECLKNGGKVARNGWNGKGMFVYLVKSDKYKAQTGVAKKYFGEEALISYNSYMAIKNVDETVSTWVPSVNDCLAEDWSELVDEIPESKPELNSVEKEIEQLEHNFKNLTNLINTRESGKPERSQIEKDLLVKQHNTMLDYLNALENRREFLQIESNKDC